MLTLPNLTSRVTSGKDTVFITPSIYARKNISHFTKFSSE